MSEGVLKGKLFCSIYKSRRKSGMYLYVDRQKGLKAVSYTHLTLPTSELV